MQLHKLFSLLKWFFSPVRLSYSIDGNHSGLSNDINADLGKKDKDKSSSSTYDDSDLSDYQKDLQAAVQAGYAIGSEGVDAYRQQQSLDNWVSDQLSAHPTMDSLGNKISNDVNLESTVELDPNKPIDDTTINLNHLDSSLEGIANLADTLAPGSYEINDYLTGIENVSITIDDSQNATITTTSADGSTTTAKTSDGFSSIVATDTYGTTTTNFNKTGDFTDATFISADGEDVSLVKDINDDGMIDMVSTGLNNNGVVDSVLSNLGLGDEYSTQITIGTNAGNVVASFESDTILADGDLTETVKSITDNINSSGSDIASGLQDLSLDNLTKITTQESFTLGSGYTGTVTKEWSNSIFDVDYAIADTSYEINTSEGTITGDLGLTGDIAVAIGNALGVDLETQIQAGSTTQAIADVATMVFGGKIVESIFGDNVASTLSQSGFIGDPSTNLAMVGSDYSAVQALGAINLYNSVTDITSSMNNVAAVNGFSDVASYDTTEFNTLSDHSNNFHTQLDGIKEVPKEYASVVKSTYSSINANYVGALKSYDVSLKEIHTSMVIQNIQQLRYEEARKVDLSGQDPYSNFAGGTAFNLGMAGSSYSSLEPRSVGDVLFDENTDAVDTEMDSVVYSDKKRFTDAGGLTFIHNLYPEAFSSKLDLESIINMDTKDRVFEVSMLKELKDNRTELDSKVLEYNNEIHRLQTLMPTLNAAIADYQSTVKDLQTTKLKVSETMLVASNDNPDKYDMYTRETPEYKNLVDSLNNTLDISTQISTALSNENYDLAESLINQITDVDYSVDNITVTDEELEALKNQPATPTIGNEVPDTTGWTKLDDKYSVTIDKTKTTEDTV